MICTLINEKYKEIIHFQFLKNSLLKIRLFIFLKLKISILVDLRNFIFSMLSTNKVQIKVTEEGMCVTFLFTYAVLVYN